MSKNEPLFPLIDSCQVFGDISEKIPLSNLKKCYLVSFGHSFTHQFNVKDFPIKLNWWSWEYGGEFGEAYIIGYGASGPSWRFTQLYPLLAPAFQPQPYPAFTVPWKDHVGLGFGATAGYLKTPTYP